MSQICNVLAFRLPCNSWAQAERSGTTEHNTLTHYSSHIKRVSSWLHIQCQRLKTQCSVMSGRPSRGVMPWSDVGYCRGTVSRSRPRLLFRSREWVWVATGAFTQGVVPSCQACQLSVLADSSVLLMKLAFQDMGSVHQMQNTVQTQQT